MAKTKTKEDGMISIKGKKVNCKVKLTKRGEASVKTALSGKLPKGCGNGFKTYFELFVWKTRVPT